MAVAKVGSHTVFGSMAVMEFVAEGGFEACDADVLASRRESGPPKPTPPAGKPAESDKTQWKLGACAGCGEPIKGGSVVEIAQLGKYHKACFKCVGCAMALTGVPWKPSPEKPGERRQPFCDECHVARFALECAGCGEKIRGGGLKINGLPYHKECKPTAARGMHRAVSVHVVLTVLSANR